MKRISSPLRQTARHNKTKEAAKTMGLAYESFHALLGGIKTLAECYAVLGGMEAASETLSDYFDRVMKCNISAAAEKAQLVEFSGSVAPEEPWNGFIKAYPMLRNQLHTFLMADSQKQHSAIEIEFMPFELQGDVNGNLP